MAPSQVQLIRCSRQAEDLFDIFFALPNEGVDKSSTCECYKESPEVHQAFRLERDSGDRLQSANDFAQQINSRSPVHHSYDERRHKRDVLEKRKSLELAKRHYGSSPGSSSNEGSPSSFGGSINSLSTQSHPVDDFPGFARDRAQSVGPSEESLKEAAVMIQHVGDKIQEEYGNKLNRLQVELIQYVHQTGRDLTYEQFAVHVNDLIGEDRNWTNFMFAMHLAKRVATQTQTIGNNSYDFFRRFIGAAFAERIVENQDVVNFVQQRNENE